MTRKEKLTALATQLNAALDLPAVPEIAEQFVCDRLVNWIAPLIDDRLLDVMLSASDGIDRMEAFGYASAVRNYVAWHLPTLIADFPLVHGVLDRLRDALVTLLTTTSDRTQDT